MVVSSEPHRGPALPLFTHALRTSVRFAATCLRSNADGQFRLWSSARRRLRLGGRSLRTWPPPAIGCSSDDAPHVALLACVLGGALSGQDSKPAAPETQSRPTGWNLRLAETARARIVELKQTAKGTMTLKRDGIEVAGAIEGSLQARWLDEISAVNEESMEARRTFIEARMSEHGRTQDPGFEGITFMMKTHGGKTTIESAPPRRPSNRDLSKQLAQAGAPGLWLLLPENAEIGASFPTKGKPLIATLVDLIGIKEISDYEATLTLDSGDPKTHRAHLSGNVRFSESVDDDGVTKTASY